MKSILKGLNYFIPVRKILSTAGKFAFRVLTGWYYLVTLQNRQLLTKRMNICRPCELRKWFVCGECGCPLVAKGRIEDEQCPHPKGNKWL